MDHRAHSVCIALGANLGDRRRTLDGALAAINDCPQTSVVACSSFIETDAAVPGDPAAALTQPAYLNAAAKITTSLSPRGLLDVLLRIEREHGRTRSGADRWAPRTLDLDLLLYEDAVIDQPGLIVPHPRLHHRLFVLEPLAQIAPDAVHPILGRTIWQLLRDLIGAPTPPLTPSPPGRGLG